MKAETKTLKATTLSILMPALFFLLITLSPFHLRSQNVGIGTTNPDEKLTVIGTIKSSINSNSNFPHLIIHEAESEYGRIQFTNTSSPQYFTLSGNPQKDSTLARFHIKNSDFGNIGSFTGHGRFGINASNPVATLHLSSQPGTDLMRIQNENNTKFRIFENNAMVFGSNWLTPIANVIRMETPNLFIGFDGNHVPEERLEVDGDVRIRGAIKADTVNGTPGQVLITGADGNIAWSNPCSYRRFEGFPIAGSVQWTVPDGVVEIMVELWGAGGGGAFGGGGGSGGYVKAIFAVNSGDILTIVTGSGGNGTSGGMSSTSTDGGASSVNGTNVSAVAIGGQSGTNTSAGVGGLFSVSPPYLSATAKNGGNGNLNVSFPFHSGTSKLQHGDGGQSPNSAKNYGQGEFVINSGPTMDHNPGSSGTAPGGGGGGGDWFNNEGGDGYVIIRWN